MKVFIVEDNKNLGSTLCEYLESQGFEISYYDNFSQALLSIQSLQTRSEVLFLLDINLPDGSGLDLVPIIKKNLNDLARIIIFSAIHDPKVKIDSINMGIDDYMTKPFDLRELLFRINKISPRGKTASFEKKVLNFGKLSISLDSNILIDASQKKIHLSEKEGNLFQLFLDHQQKYISRDEIIDKIYHNKENFNYRTIDNILVKFRKWCSTDPESPLSFQSLRGKGYGLFIKE
ncbi:response regulator transcription factor [Bacteriovoracaceae bacterium]|nr:response regulator transcription factor [Bacteriovoracaceae bacterium]